MNRTLQFAALFLCLLLCSPAVYGQGRCTLQTIVGTYALTSTGSSTIVLGPASDGFHWNAAHGPIAVAGRVTIKPDGSVDGFYWFIAGTHHSGLDPVHFKAKITEMNVDCTGLVEWIPPVVKERFVVLDNGREIQSIVTQHPVPTNTWTATLRRINGSCGQHKIHGLYLLTCKSLGQLPVSPPNIFAGAALIRMLIAPGGDFIAKLYGKLGPAPFEFPASGNLTVHDDCTAEGTLSSPALPYTSVAKGVFFNEGRDAYWLPIVNRLPDGSTSPAPYSYCTITRE